jgi:toxin CcdB
MIGMARFDVHRLRVDGKLIYAVDVQADLLSELSTRVMVPLLPGMGEATKFRDLNPAFDIGGQRCVLWPQQPFVALIRQLRKPVVSLANWQDEIKRALDCVFTGF